jgi:hypothetical protein
MPGRYVGTEEEESDGILFEDKMQTLTLPNNFKKEMNLKRL